MAAPAFGSVGTVASGVGTSVACGAPASVSAGDMLVAVIGTNAATTITGLPTGWAHAPGSPLTVPVGGTNNKVTLNVMWKRATGTDSYTFTQSASDFHEGAAMRFTSVVASGNPWDGSSSNTATDNTQGTVNPAVAFTTTGADEMFVAAWSNWAGGTWTNPSGFTLAFGTSSAKIVMADYKVQAATGSSGSISATCASTAERASWLGALIGTTGGGSQVNGDASLTVTDAVTATSQADWRVSTATTVTGTLATAAAVSRPASTSTSVTDTITAVAAVARPAGTSLAVSNTLAVAAAAARPASAAFTVNSAVTAAATVVSAGANVALSAVNTVTAVASVTRAAQASLAVSSAITAVGANGQSRFVIRPDTGPVARPAAGTASRPNTGTTTRPHAGTVTRPNTGLVIRP